MKVVVLGCGPAGLLTAYAVHQSGHEPLIFSRYEKSTMPGAIYLHEAIPGLTNDQPDDEIFFAKLGTREGYARKVYGDPRAPCSWDAFEHDAVRPAWDMATTYDRLWDLFHKDIKPAEITPPLIEALVDDFPVFSTIPRFVLCDGSHNFLSRPCWIRTHSQNNRGTVARQNILYNGDPSTPWYRQSTWWDHTSWEFGWTVPNSVEGRKVLGHNCDCFPEVTKLGRFGKWEKGVLVNHAYREALNAVQSL